MNKKKWRGKTFWKKTCGLNNLLFEKKMFVFLRIILRKTQSDLHFLGKSRLPKKQTRPSMVVSFSLGRQTEKDGQKYGLKPINPRSLTARP